MNPLRGSSQACWSIAAGSCLPETGCSSSAVKVRTTGNHHLRTLEEGLLEQGVQPWLELFVEIVDEYCACRSDCRDVGCGRLVQLTVPAGPDDGLDLDMIATD